MTESLPYARNFRELVVYQKSRRLAGEVFHLSKEEIGRLLGGVMARSAAFCNPTALREPLVEYFIVEAANDDQ